MNTVCMLQTTKEFRILCELLYLTPEQVLQFYIDAVTPGETNSEAQQGTQAIAALLLLKTARKQIARHTRP